MATTSITNYSVNATANVSNFTAIQDASPSIDKDQEAEYLQELKDYQEKLANGQMTNEDFTKVQQLLNSATNFLPEDVRLPLIENKHDCAIILSNAFLDLQKTTNADEHEQINHGVLTALKENAVATSGKIYAKNYDSELPFSILSMQILSTASQIMSDQSNLALQKIEDMTKLIEQLQALVSLMTAVTAKLSQTAATKAKDNNSSMDAYSSSIGWHDVANDHHGVGVEFADKVNLHDFIGTHCAFDPSNFKKDPLGQWMLDKGFLSLRYDSLCGAGNCINREGNGMWDGDNFLISKLSPSDRKDFMDKLSQAKTKDYGSWLTNAKIEYKGIYDSDGNYMSLDNNKLNGSIFFTSKELKGVPDSLKQKLCTPLYTSKDNLKNAEPDYYGVNGDAITAIYGSICDIYRDVMGEKPDDFNSENTSSVTASLKSVENINSVMQQKIQYIQQKQTSLSKTPESAKEDSDRKLDMFNNIVRSLAY